VLAFFFPRDLNRKQYCLRWLALFGFVILGLTLFVAALIKGTAYLVWLYASLAYWIVGLAAPRLRNAGQSPWFALLCALLLINVAMLIYLFAVPEKHGPPTLPGQG
jgi:uncharacterized membrane protein YhaH (DUF805 family)